jgi:hypothetical protein
MSETQIFSIFYNIQKITAKAIFGRLAVILNDSGFKELLFFFFLFQE